MWSHRVPSAAHSVFWDLYCAAPDRREACEHSSEAKVFQDYVSLQVLESGPLLLFLFVCLCICWFSEDRVSLCNFVCLGTQSIDQVDLYLPLPPECGTKGLYHLV